MTRLVALACALLCLALPASALADATVSISGGVILFDEDDANTDVQINDIGGGTVQFSSTTSVSSAPGCTGAPGTLVNCPLAGITRIDTAMGGGNDRVCNMITVCNLSIPVNHDGQGGNDSLFGTGNAAAGDVLTGGPGADSMNAQTGPDTLNAQDGEADTLLDCGTGAGTDIANVDAEGVDSPVNCETVNRPAAAAAGGGTPPAAFVPGVPNPFVAIATPSATKKMPDLDGSGKSFISIRTAEERLNALNIPYDIDWESTSSAPDGAENDDVIKQSPKAGASVTGTATKPFDVELTYVRGKPKPVETGCKSKVKLGRDEFPLADYIENKYWRSQDGRDGAYETLGRQKCEFDAEFRDDRKVTTAFVDSAKVVSQKKKVKGKTTKTNVMRVVVVRPKQPDFFLVTRPANVSGQDLTFGTDYALTEAKYRNFSAITVQVGEIASGRLVPNVQVELYDVKGDGVSFRSTGPKGETTFRFRTEQAGQFEIRATDIKDNKVLQGWRTERVVKRGNSYKDLLGTEWKYREDKPVGLYESQAPKQPPTNLGVGTLSTGGVSSANPKAAPIKTVKGIRGQVGGQLVTGPVNAAQVPLAGSVLVASAPGLLTLGGQKLIGNDSAGLVGNAGGTLGSIAVPLVGQDGGTLVGQDGASLISDKGAGILADGGSGLVGQDGGSLVGQDGASLAPGSYIPSG